MTLSTSMQRAQIVIPAQGMIEDRDTLTELLKEFGTEDSLGEEGLILDSSLLIVTSHCAMLLLNGLIHFTSVSAR